MNLEIKVRRIYWLFFIFTIFITILPTALLASSPIKEMGQITNLKGEVKIYRNPIKKLPKAGATANKNYLRALYLGEYWEVYQAQKGFKVFTKDHLLSFPGGSLEIKLHNGGEILLSENTTLIINETPGKQLFNLVSGFLRAIIHKYQKQPEFKTTAISLGIRGTDFIMDKRLGQSKVSCLAGKVAVKSRLLKNAPERVIPEGQFTHVKEPKNKQSWQRNKAKLKPRDLKKYLAQFNPPKPKPLVLKDLKRIKKLSQLREQKDEKLDKMIAQKKPRPQPKVVEQESEPAVRGLSFRLGIGHGSISYDKQLPHINFYKEGDGGGPTPELALGWRFNDYPLVIWWTTYLSANESEIAAFDVPGQKNKAAADRFIRLDYINGLTFEWGFFRTLTAEKLSQFFGLVTLGLASHAIDLEKTGMFSKYEASSGWGTALLAGAGYEQLYNWWGWYGRGTLGYISYADWTTLDIKANEDNGKNRDEEVSLGDSLSGFNYGIYFGLQFHISL